MDVIRRSPCLVPIQPEGTRTPLFMFPGIGGNVLNFQPLIRQLPADQPVIGLQSLGLIGDHQPLLTIGGIAGHFVDEVRSVQPTGPYRLGGFSFGGIVGLEVARQLMNAGERVELLALFDPLLDTVDFTGSAGRSGWLGRIGLLHRRVAHHMRAVLAVAPGQLPHYASAKWRTIRRRIKSRVRREALSRHEAAQHGTETPLDLMPSLRRVRDANVLAVKRYVPEPYLGVVTLFRAMERGLEPVDSDANWRYVAAGGLRVVDIPGDHLSMLDPPNVLTLAAALNDALQRAAVESREDAGRSPAVGAFGAGPLARTA